MPPAGARVRQSGGGTSVGSEGISVSAEAEITGPLTPPALADHYEGQLQEHGWLQLGTARSEDMAWSAWTFTEEGGRAWRATFWIVPQAGEEESYLAVLRVEGEG